MTSLVVAAVIFVGIVSYKQLSVSDLPTVAYPTLVVSANLPGANPETMANSVTTPLERAFMTIEGLKTITSTSSQGTSEITMQFSLDHDINAAAQDISAQISASMPLLPPNMPTNPTYQKVNPSSSPVLYLLLTSNTMKLSELYNYANTFVGERLSIIPGVAKVTTYGSAYAARIQVDPQIVAARSLDLSTVSSIISASNVNQPMGAFDGPNRYFLMNADGQLIDAKGYNDIVVTYQNNAPLYISGLGIAIDSVKDNKSFTRYISRERDENCCVVAVQKQGGANTVKVNQAILDYLPELEKQLPASIHMEVIFDQSVSILKSVEDVKLTLLLAFLLVVIVIYVYLGKVTDTVIPILVLPMSIVGTFFLMYLLGFSLDNLSLLALTLAIGFVIDDAIVVLENIVRHTENGETPYQAAMNGSRQISITILTMTICLSSVFIPMLFMEGMLGRIFREFSITIVIAILFSGAISLTLTPMLCSRFIPKREPPKEGKPKKHTFSEKLNVVLVREYGKLLGHVIHHPYIMLSLGLIFLIATILIFRAIPSTLEDKQDIGFILASTQTAQDASTKETVQHQLLVNNIVKNDPNVQDFVSVAGQTPNSGLLFIRLKPEDERIEMQEVIDELYPKLFALPGINTFLKSIPMIDLSATTGGGAGSYQYLVSSFDLQKLYTYAKKMSQKVSTLPGFRNVTDDIAISTPQMYLHLDREKLSMYGLSAGTVETILGLAFSGGKISTILTAENEYDVILEVLPQFQKNPESLKYLWLRTQTANGNKVVPLSDVVTKKMTIGPAVISHYNQFPSVTISFNLAPNVALSDASKMLAKAAEEILPSGVSGQIVGAALAFQATMDSLMMLMILAVLFIYMLLGILYESFVLPITVISALPIAMLGALITLLIFGQILSLFALVGIMLLIGIVQKNGIMLIDFANEYLKEPGKTPEEAIYQACLVRFRPIIMTTIAAIMGALPIALGLGYGGAARQPLGLVIVGGLIFSQAVTLFLTPIVFIHFEHLESYIVKKYHIKRHHEMA